MAASGIAQQTAKEDSLHQVRTDSLASVIKEQNEQLTKFRSLQEEMMAKTVFEKSKSYLLWWISMSGIVILVITLFGFTKTRDYIIKVLQRKIDSESSKIIEEYIHNKIPLDKISSQIETKGIEKLNELIAANKKSFDELVEKSKSDFQDFSKQMNDSRQQLKNQPIIGRNMQEEKTEMPAGERPPLIDHSSSMEPVRDSGSLGAVVGFTLAYAMEFFIAKQLNKKVIISALYIYYQARKMKGFEKTDSGAYLGDAVTVGMKTGVISEKDWPYKINKFAAEPPKSIDKSPHYFIGDASQVKTNEQIIDALANYGPVIIGITVYSSFMKTNKKGIIPMPGVKETVVGGFSICLVGYDDKPQLFKFKNCWGKEWGENGYGYIPYAYIVKFSDDGWAIRKVREDVPAV